MKAFLSSVALLLLFVLCLFILEGVLGREVFKMNSPFMEDLRADIISGEGNIFSQPLMDLMPELCQSRLTSYEGVSIIYLREVVLFTQEQKRVESILNNKSLAGVYRQTLRSWFQIKSKIKRGTAGQDLEALFHLLCYYFLCKKRESGLDAAGIASHLLNVADAPWTMTFINILSDHFAPPFEFR